MGIQIFGVLGEQFQIFVFPHSGTCRNDMSDDNIFLQPPQTVCISCNSCVGKNPGGFLKTGCGKY